jgi:type II secretory pathway component PulF
MNYYRYKLIAPTGQLSSGVIKLPYQDIMSAITHLERDGSITILVRHLGPVLTFFLKLATLRLRRRVKRTALAEMLSNISVMLRSGLTLVTALQEAAGSADLPEVQGDISDMIVSIQSGVSFSEAARNYPQIFPATVLHLVRMGEETGQLDRMLKDAAEHLKRVDRIISDTKQALLYPAMVFLVMGGGLTFWFYYVVPKIVSLFKEMEVTLPPITRFLIAMSNFTRQHLAMMILAVGATLMLLQVARRSNQRFRRHSDALLLRIPIARTLISASNLAFITEYFSMLLNAGIDILQSFKIIIDSVRNEYYKEKLVEVRNGIARGEGIADCFRAADFFPAFVVRMIGVGEMSGSLTQQLDYLSQEYREKLSALVATLGKLLEPLVIIIAGVFFAIIIIALLLPIYDLVSKIST